MGRCSSLFEIFILIAFVWLGVVLYLYSSLRHIFEHTEPRKAEDLKIDLTCDGVRISSNSRECFRRLEFIQENHANNDCFRHHGLQDEVTKCSILKYLVQIEDACPDISAQAREMYTKKQKVAKRGENFGQLYNQLDRCGDNCKWIMNRIKDNEKSWQRAYDKLFHHDEIEITQEDGTVQHLPREKRTVFMHMALLSEEFGLNFGKGALVGGPLGELAQWADLISSIYVLGHKIILSWSKETLAHHITTANTPYEECRSARPMQADLFYTDVHGLRQLYELTGSLNKIRCTLRVLDNFGTEPAYNHASYVLRNGLPKGYGQFNLNPQQFLTQWPHTPDNSFVGFVVHKANAEKMENNARNSTRALLYGKREAVLHSPDIKNILSELKNQNFDIHATLWTKKSKESSPEEQEDYISSVPDFITNHGYVNQSTFQQLLRSSKVYIGLGSPPEGPAALEAVANGAIFLQPRFKPKKDVYEKKPTSRKLSSQNPYMETLGRPMSFTYNQFDAEDIVAALTQIRHKEITPFVPFEFTHEGMLQRIHAYLQHQNFCTETDWPPKSSMRVKLGASGNSCNEVCEGHGLRCENSWFKHINSKEAVLQKTANCREWKFDAEIIAPFIDDVKKGCTLQKDHLLSSCAGRESVARRLCPCRDFLKGQIALCKDCK